MRNSENEINQITGIIIRLSLKLILTAILILLFYEGASKGYEFGHEIFYSSAMSQAPGVDKEIVVKEGESVQRVARELKSKGLIHNEYSFYIQAKFYDYTVYPGTYTCNTAQTSKDILELMSVKPEDTEETEAGS